MGEKRDASTVVRERPETGGGTSSSADNRNVLKPRREFWKWAGPALSITIVSISIAVLVHTLSKESLTDIKAAISATSYRHMAIALLFTGVSYLALTGYDAIALRQLRLKVPYRTTALGSFTSYAISFTVGFYIVTAGAVRYWIYSRAGLSAGKIATLTVIAGVTFWLGTAAVIGFGLVFQASAISNIDQLPPAVNIAIGIAVLALISGYLAWVSIEHRWTRIRGFYLELPGFSLTLGQMALGVVDVCAGAAALYVLLPAAQAPEFPMFAAVYALACLLGMASNAPASAGVLEATMFKVLVTSPALVASVILFRVIYYLVPFVLGVLVLLATEGIRRIRAPADALARSGSKS